MTDYSTNNKTVGDKITDKNDTANCSNVVVIGFSLII